MPCPSRRRVKNGSNKCFSTSSVMPQPLSSTIKPRFGAADRDRDRDRAAGFEAVEAVGDQVQHDLLDFLGQISAITGSPSRSTTFLF